MRRGINPDGYLIMSVVDFEKICNGAGSSQSSFDFVPDTMYGLNMNDAANRHDFMYHFGTTRLDKIIADCVYLWNNYAIIEDNSWWFIILRKNRAVKYVMGVNVFGDSSFFIEEKNNKHEECKGDDSSKNWDIIKAFLDTDANSTNYKDIIKEIYNEVYDG